MGTIKAARRMSVRAAALAGMIWGVSAARADVLAHWTFDSASADTGEYADTEGNKHPARPQEKKEVTVFGGKAPFGGAVTFNGKAGSFLNAPALDRIQRTSLTITAWVNLTKVSPVRANYVITDWPSPSLGVFSFGVDPAGSNPPKANPFADLRSADTANAASRGGGGRGRGQTTERIPVVRVTNSKKDVTLGEWHHLSWVWDRADAEHGTMTIYLDGEVVAQASQTHAPVDLPQTFPTMRIGSRYDATRPQTPNNIAFNGSMDELWVFNAALSGEQVNYLIKTNKTDWPVSAPVAVKPGESPTVASAASPVSLNAVPLQSTQLRTTPPEPAPLMISSGAPPQPAARVASPTNPTPPQPQPVAVTPIPLTAATPVPVPAARVEAPPEVLPPMTAPREMPSMPRVVVIAKPPSGSPVKSFGVALCLAWSLGMSIFIGWGLKERARLKGLGKL